jgi:tetratricopeptide (TPR) repeat protein
VTPAAFNVRGAVAWPLLAAALAAAPLAAQSTNGPGPTVNTNDPVQVEYRKILADDDAAGKEIVGWMDNASAAARMTLHLRAERRLAPIRREYEDFVERHPGHVNARLAFGSFLNESGDEEGAIKQWEAARQLAPTNPAAWDNLANVYAHAGPIAKAFEYYDKAISLDTNQSVYYHNLAVTVYLFRKDAAEYYHLTEPQVFDKSLELYRQAIKLDPDNFVLFSDYAESFYGTIPPRWQDGLEAWTQALKIAHDEVEREGVYIHLARIHLKLGQYDQARTNLDAVTNANYAALKNRLTRNLDAAMGKTVTNAVPRPK